MAAFVKLITRHVNVTSAECGLLPLYFYLHLILIVPPLTFHSSYNYKE